MGLRYWRHGLRPKVEAAVSTIQPTDIVGCKLWLDFSDATTLFTDAGSTQVSSDGDLIYQANDKSGEGNNATQSGDSAYRPTYKVNIQNSLSVARGLTGDRGLNVNLALSQPVTVFIVVKTDGTDDNHFSDGLSNTTGRLPLVGVSSGNLAIYAGALLSGSSISTNYQLISAVFNGASSRLYKDGNSQASGNAGTQSCTSFAIMRGFNTNQGLLGDMAEYIIYNSALSDTDRQSVETYLNNKWSIY
jgi:hypothetical protein